MSSDVTSILSGERSAGARSTQELHAEFLSALSQSPFEYGFFATLRRLECQAKDSPRIGQTVRPSEDCVRLGQQPTLAFSAAQVSAYLPQKGTRAPRMLVNGPGLLGPNGPLPVHLTEYIHERRTHFSDDTLWRFVDLFHHRMFSLLYRAWANTQPTVNADRREDNRFTRYVASLMGLGLESLEHRDAFPDGARLHYVGHLARQSRSPDGLIGAIEDFFEVKASLVQFVGEWMEIPESSLWRLGQRRKDSGLGFGTTLGGSVWSCQHKFRIVVGPVDFDAFQRFLPGSENANRLASLVRTFCGDEYDWDLQLVLDKNEVPVTQLGQQGLLGRTTWLQDEHREHDALDALLQPASGAWKSRAA